MKKQFRSFEDARKFVRKLRLRSKIAWTEYVKSGQKPDDIPSLVRDYYLKKGWISWGDFLGTNNVKNGEQNFWTFKKSREYVHKLHIKSQKEWRQKVSEREIPKEIPSRPDSHYKNKGWKSWPDWLGTDRIATKIISQNWLPWKIANPIYKKISKENNLKSFEDWKKYIKKHKLPKGLPPYPADIYTEERVRKMMR
jgi:hypothetical protein